MAWHWVSLGSPLAARVRHDAQFPRGFSVARDHMVAMNALVGEEWRTPTPPIGLSNGRVFEVSSHGRTRHQTASGSVVVGKHRKAARQRVVGLLENGTTLDVSLANLVNSTFNGPQPTPQHFASPLNNNRGDLRACNLAWTTQREAAACGLRMPRGKLQEESAPIIWTRPSASDEWEGHATTAIAAKTRKCTLQKMRLVSQGVQYGKGFEATDVDPATETADARRVRHALTREAHSAARSARRLLNALKKSQTLTQETALTQQALRPKAGG